MSRPFDNAKYQALLKGLEITVAKFSEILMDNPVIRIDSEYFAKETRRFLARLGKDGIVIRDVAASRKTKFTPGKIGTFRYIEISDVQGNGTVTDTECDMAEAPSRATWLVKAGDVLTSTVRPNRRLSALVMPEQDGCVASSGFVVLQPKRIAAEVLLTYLRLPLFCDLMDLNTSASLYPAISETDLLNLPIPNIKQKVSEEIVKTVRKAYALLHKSNSLVATAEQTLLDALGLAEWQPPDPLTYTCSSQAVLTAGRFDSQYFAPRVAQLLSRLGGDGRTIRDVAPPRTVKFKPGKDSTFRYIEIGDVQSNGTATDSELETDAAPSRATWLVKAGDVLTSTVRPNRRLSALVATEQNGCVASSGFVVLKPVSITPEVLLTYLRLPVFCELMDLHTSASLYPAISTDDLLSLPIPNIPPQVSATITGLVRSAHTLRGNSQVLLERAKQAVELAIEEGESAGLSLFENNI